MNSRKTILKASPLTDSDILSVSQDVLESRVPSCRRRPFFVPGILKSAVFWYTIPDRTQDGRKGDCRYVPGFCGFTGQVTKREEVIREMAGRSPHRGRIPRDIIWTGTIAMAFRRLSIIDLGGGSQPIYNEDRSKVLMFNGEIYNYRSLRQDLLAAGHVFITETDSEVLLHGFEEWGEDLLPRLRGMFAFAIWDKREDALFLARDNFGIKPMHYTLLPTGAFLFGSEIKSLLAHPDFVKEFRPEALDAYLSFQYSLPRETFFKGVYCLQPGHCLWVPGRQSQRAPLF